MKEKIINIIQQLDQITLCHFDDLRWSNEVYIRKITKEENDRLNAFKKSGIEQYYKINEEIIKEKDIYFYGTVDFNNKKDIKLINDYNLVNDNGDWIKKYDYDSSTLITTNNKPTIYQTFNPVTLFKYKYCILGKPEYIIVYRKSFKLRK